MPVWHLPASLHGVPSLSCTVHHIPSARQAGTDGIIDNDEVVPSRPATHGPTMREGSEWLPCIASSLEGSCSLPPAVARVWSLWCLELRDQTLTASGCLSLPLGRHDAFDLGFLSPISQGLLHPRPRRSNFQVALQSLATSPPALGSLGSGQLPVPASPTRLGARSMRLAHRPVT